MEFFKLEEPTFYMKVIKNKRILGEKFYIKKITLKTDLTRNFPRLVSDRLNYSFFLLLKSKKLEFPRVLVKLLEILTFRLYTAINRF